jgi:putative oxidoreductase
MKQTKLLDAAQLILRIASGFSFFYYGCDRLGFWGKYGQSNVSWGDWSHFMDYASKVMGFLPYSVAQICAAISTAAEAIFGLMLLVGFKTKWAALGIFFLAGFYGICMTISFGVFVPLSYSVFTFSAAGLLLSCVDRYKWSIDNLILAKK